MAAPSSLLSLALLAATALLLARPAAGVKKSKDWNKVDFDKVEGEWRYGDEEDELITDDEILFREMEKRQEKGIDISEHMDVETVRHQQSMAGPAMMFIELKPKPDGGQYIEEELYNMSGIWKDLLYTGGYNVNFYNIEDQKMLCSMQKGWDGKGVRDFLVDRPEVAKVTWDQHDYQPVDEEAEAEALRRRRAERKALAEKKAKKKKKKKKKKKAQGKAKSSSSSSSAAAAGKAEKTSKKAKKAKRMREMRKKAKEGNLDL